MRNKLILWVVLFVAGLLVGFIPQYSKVKALRQELSTDTQELASSRVNLQLCHLQDLAAMTYLDATRQNYGSAAEQSSRFFKEAQEFANQTTEANLKRALEGVLSARDTITAELAKGNPAVVADLQALLLKTHELAAR